MNPDRPIVRIERLTKRFGQVVAVDEVSLEIQANEFFALLGPSGCGKTTLLRMLAGFDSPSAGGILIDGDDMASVAPNRRPVNMVFQSYAVFPHMSVADNVAYGLMVSGVPRSEIAPRVAQALAMVRLENFETRKPDQLSGGQRQRVALARALVKRPKVLLLDEPLSALDRKLREEMQLELVRLQHEVGITFVIVTHDQEEALSMADRIAVMDRGRLLQIAPPQELYESPNCHMVADFIGKMNLFQGRILTADGNRIRVAADGLGEIELSDQRPLSGEVSIAVRPEKIRLSLERPADGSIALPGKVAQLAYFGDTSQLYVDGDQGIRIVCHRSNLSRTARAPFALGDRCWVSLDPADCLVLAD